jgi:hypothetical protein
MSTLGKILYKIYYKPIAQRSKVKKFGGKRNYRLMVNGEREMRNYVFNNLRFDPPNRKLKKYRINFLSGENYIHQTLFCIYTFFKFLTDEEKSEFLINIYDDGTLQLTTFAFLEKNFPFIDVIDKTTIEKEVAKKLPLDKYPFLNMKLKNFPLIKKLVYNQMINTGLNCFFDSDMLFVKKPVELLHWLKKSSADPKNAFCIQDIKRSYGYSEMEITKVWPDKINRNINSGLYAMHSNISDPDIVEFLIRKLENSYGSNYYMEQMITAILLELHPNLYQAKMSTYIVMPTSHQVQNCEGELHHFVDTSKLYYFKHAWRKAI